MKKLIAITILFVAFTATANEKLVSSCMIPIPNTIEATSCSNFELEKERDRLFIDGMCKFADGTPSKELCPTENVQAICTVDLNGEITESYYYDFSSNKEVTNEENTCEKSMKGTFEIL